MIETNNCLRETILRRGVRSVLIVGAIALTVIITSMVLGAESDSG